MKMICREHGAHFAPDDGFVECNGWWKIRGMEKLAPPARMELAEWIFAMPADKIWLETGFGVALNVHGDYIGFENALTNIPGYEDMTDEERQNYQRWQIKQELEKQNRKKGWRKWLRR